MERRTTTRTLIAAGLAAMTMAWTTPAVAQADTSEPEMLRSLDIMLMVTALRCRFGPDDFQPEYNRFAARHLSTMNEAARELQAHYALRVGHARARQQLDRLNTGIANRYGRGHPWLECADLAMIARDLADQPTDRQVLLSAAGDLLDETGRGRETLLARYGNQGNLLYHRMVGACRHPGGALCATANNALHGAPATLHPAI